MIKCIERSLIFYSKYENLFECLDEYLSCCLKPIEVGGCRGLFYDVAACLRIRNCNVLNRVCWFQSSDYCIVYINSCKTSYCESLSFRRWMNVTVNSWYRGFLFWSGTTSEFFVFLSRAECSHQILTVLV